MQEKRRIGGGPAALAVQHLAIGQSGGLRHMSAHRARGGGMQMLLHLLYPPRCLGCGGLVESDFGLCGSCWRDTPFIAGLACDACGAPLPGQSDRAEHCDDCLRSPRPWARGRAALLYQGMGRRLVLALKHGDRQDIAGTAGRWMARAAQDLCAPDSLLVPVPLHPRRHLARRYNQAALLARAMAAALGVETCPDALVRRHATPSLDGHGAEARFALLAGQLAVNPARAARLAGRGVIVVDDVMTSGATLCAATTACHAAGAKEVCTAVLARVAKAT